MIKQYFQFQHEEEGKTALLYLWLGEYYFSNQKASKLFVYSHLKKLFSKSRQKAAVWKSFKCCIWATHKVVLVIKKGTCIFQANIPSTVAMGKGVTQPVSMDGVHGYGAFADDES